MDSQDILPVQALVYRRAAECRRAHAPAARRPLWNITEVSPRQFLLLGASRPVTMPGELACQWVQTHATVSWAHD